MKKTAITVMMLALSLVLAATAFAAVCPTATPLGALNGLTDPNWVAVDSKGNVYVTENMTNTVKVFNYNAQLIAKFKVSNPLGVAVDDTYIYVSSEDGYVYRYDYGYAFVSKFKTRSRYPVGLAVDADKIYITYPTGAIIYVYSKAGIYQYELAGDGAGFLPISITVDKADGNLYAVNKAPAGALMFNNTGGFVSRISSDVALSGGFIGDPRGIAVDLSRKLYISDAAMLNIQVFDIDTQQYICGIPASETLIRPFGMSMSENGVLYLADKEASKVYKIGLDSYTLMRLSTKSLGFQGSACGASVQSKSFTIYNDGVGLMSWQISSDKPWLTASSMSGEIAGGGYQELTVYLNTDGVADGSEGTLTVTAPGVTQKVNVSVSIASAPTLTAGPDSFSFFVKGSDIPGAETMTVDLAGDTLGTTEWTAVSDSGWLSVSPSSGQSGTLALADVSVNVAGLDGGLYAGNVTVSANCSLVAPIVIPVSMTYIKGGTITVNTNLDEAGFTLTGPATYTGIGRSFTAEAVPDGVYTISYDKISGFVTPKTMSLSVLDGQTTTFEGTYKDLRKRMRILATMGRFPMSATDELRVFDGSGTQLAMYTLDSTISNKNEKLYSTKTAVADITGDGISDILTASGKLNVVMAYALDGTAIAGTKFVPFDSKASVAVKGTEVAVADFDGDGVSEIVTYAASNPASQPSLRIFKVVGGQVMDTGVNVTIGYTGKNGLNASIADINDDGKPEVLLTPGSLDNGSPVAVNVKVLTVDTSAGVGNWSVTDNPGFAAGSSVGKISIAAGDLDGDGVHEIVVSTADSVSAKASKITVYKADGTQYGTSLSVESKDGVTIAVGDIDYNGIGEIVVGDSGADGSSSRVRVYTAGGSLIGEFKAFTANGASGVNISLGELGF